MQTRFTMKFCLVFCLSIVLCLAIACSSTASPTTTAPVTTPPATSTTTVATTPATTTPVASQTQAPATRTIVDFQGLTVTIPTPENIERVAILTSPPNIITFVLGVNDKMCATSNVLKFYLSQQDLPAFERYSRSAEQRR